MRTPDAGRQGAGRAPGIAGAWLRGRAPTSRGALLALLVVLSAGAGSLLLVFARGPAEREVAAVSVAASNPAAAESAPAAEPSTSERTAIRPIRPHAAEAGPDLDRAVPVREPTDPRGPRTEAEYLVELRALARSDPDAFGRRAESILAGVGPACEQFASARAAYEESWPGTNDLCVRTVSTLSHASDPQAESVPQALVHWLGQRAQREPRARESLTAIVWSGSPPVEPVFRVRALRALVLSSPEEDLALLASRIHAEGDPDVHSAGRAALDERARPGPTPESSQEFP